MTDQPQHDTVLDSDQQQIGEQKVSLVEWFSFQLLYLLQQLHHEIQIT